MIKNKLLHKFILAVLTVSMSITFFTGCKSSSSNSNGTEKIGATSSTADKTSNKNGKNSEEMKKNITDTINSLVTAGTINSDQGNKIIDSLTTMGRNRNNTDNNNNNNNNNNSKANNNNSGSKDKNQNRQSFNPLSKLVEDKTITQEQADAVMQKLRDSGAYGSRQNGKNPNNNNTNNNGNNTSQQ